MAEWTWTEEQLAALRLDGHGKLVLAGAGSGKTTVLAERYVRLLEPGKRPEETLEPRHIVAMTFSRKAAVNLQAKIHKTLLKRQQEDPDNASHWHRQRERMPWARVGTIHSICGTLLSMYPVEAGVDPGFTVGESVQDRSERVSARLRLLVWRRDEHLAVLLDHFKKLEPIQSLLERLLERPDLVEAMRHLVADPDTTAQHLDDVLVAGLGAFEETTDIGATGHAQFVNALGHLLALLEPLLDAGDEPRRQMVFDDLEFYALGLLQQGGEAAETIRSSIHHLLVDEFQDTSSRQWDLIRELVRGMKGELNLSRLFLVGDDKQSIYGFRSADVTVIRAAREAFAATGAPESDWLVELSDNYRTQAGLLTPLNEAFAAMLPGEGDERKAFEAMARPLYPQRESNREAPPHFGLALGHDLSREEVFSYLANHLRDEVGTVSVVDPESGEARPLRFEDIGVLFRTRTHIDKLESALRAAGLPYRVVKGRGFLQKQEVLDLIHLLTALSDPRDDVAMIGTLRSPLLGLSDPAVAALRLDFGGDFWSTWRRYVTGKAAESEWFAALRAEDHEAIAAGWRAWQRWTRIAERHGPVNVLLDALTARGALAAYSAGRRGEQREANIYRFIDVVRDFVVDGAFTIRRVVERLKRELEAPEEENEKEAEVDAQAGITLMTIHAAKGLEFPYVILPELDGSPRKQGIAKLQRGHLFLGGERRVPLADPLFGQLAEAIDGKNGNTIHHAMYNLFAPAEEAAERQRLIYVGATRARDRLLLISRIKVLEASKTKPRRPEIPESSHLRQWINALGVEVTADGINAENSIDGVLVTSIEPPDGVRKAVNAATEREFVLLKISLHKPPTPDRWTLPFTAFATWLADPSPKATMNLVWFSGESSGDDVERDSESAVARGEALWLGDAVHRLYQAFGPGCGWETASGFFEEMLDHAGMDPADRDRLRARAQQLLKGGNAVKTVAVPENAKRELAIRLRLGNLTLRGQADLAWRSGDSARVLDYKTNALQGGVTADDVMVSHGYDHQVQLYGLALLEAWGLDGATGTLLFLDGGEMVEQQVGRELRAFYEEKVARLSAQWRELANGAGLQNGAEI